MHATYRRTLLCILLLSSVCAKAQIIAPDTVICMDTLKSISAVTYEAENVWAFDTTDIGQGIGRAPGRGRVLWYVWVTGCDGSHENEKAQWHTMRGSWESVDER